MNQTPTLPPSLSPRAPVVTIFGKSWDLHVKDIMANTQEENLAMIEESIAFLISRGREVIYDAEHFYDGFKTNPEFALKTLEAAVKGGTRCLVLCDTNGGCPSLRHRRPSPPGPLPILRTRWI